MHDAANAVTTHLRVLEIEPKDPDALASLDRLYLNAAMYDDLVEILRRRIEVIQDPDEQMELYFRRGALFSDALGDLEQALKCYTSVLEQESRNRRALEAIESIHFRREDWKKLLETYEKLIDVADADAEMADIYARIRPGTDIAFLNAIINYILENKLYDEQYVRLHTNALYTTGEAFGFDDGLFAGYKEDAHKYDLAAWSYKLGADKKPVKAKSLDDPHCVFMQLRKFYSRYTLEMATNITGIPAEQIKKIADTMAKNRPGTIMYAPQPCGWMLPSSTGTLLSCMVQVFQPLSERPSKSSCQPAAFSSGLSVLSAVSRRRTRMLR
jgi:tetratricopeptide (TPR) repeat protein